MSSEETLEVAHKAQPSRVHEYGGVGPLLHIAHANGFPPGAYSLLAQSLSRRHRVVGFPLRPLWPNSQPREAPSWYELAIDLIQMLESLPAKGIVGLGHSLGGVVTMLAAVRRPDLFSSVILVEPVILPPSWLKVLGLMRRVGLGQRQPLVQGALGRRRTWRDSETCFQYFRHKQFFAGLSDKALRDYVASGVYTRSDGQVELAYPAEWEAHIFATVPIDVWRQVRLLKTPVTVIRGELSDTFRPDAQRRMERMLPNAQFSVISSSGHLVPMERPEETAEATFAFLDRDS
jgi:pimeloyl-ACP methyl ester carboxylesterase